MPFAGAFLAFLFYELVYKKTQKMLNRTREENDLEEEAVSEEKMDVEVVVDAYDANEVEVV